MKEITYYIADDGTQFTDEDECLFYEAKTELNNLWANCKVRSIHMWNEDFKPIYIERCESLDDMRDVFENIHYVIGTDLKALQIIFYDLGYEYFGYLIWPSDGMKAGVRYYYDVEDCTFKNFDYQYGDIIRFSEDFKIPDNGDLDGRIELDD